MQLYSFAFKVMGGPAELQLAGENPDAVQPVAQALEKECRRIEAKFSRYDFTSTVSQINNVAGSAGMEVDDEFAALFDYAGVCFVQSDGLFDITSGILRQAWDFKGAVLPTPNDIAALLPKIGWEKVIWRRPYIQLSLPGMEIDLGGLAKEYAVDRCVALAQAAQIPAGLVNLAGDVRVFGKPPGAAHWSIGLVHPRHAGETLARIQIDRGAVATSGDYERYFEINGKRYCHILNPKTGYPVDELQSVSVVAESCLIAGTASTIAMLYGATRGLSFLDELGLPYISRTALGELKRAGVREG